MRDIRTGINVALENRDEGIAFLFREPRAIPVQIRATMGTRVCLLVESAGGHQVLERFAPQVSRGHVS